MLLGVHAYQALEDLPGVERNVAALGEMLTGGTVWDLPPGHCVRVPASADVPTVRGELRRVAAEATDTLLVYFAGHGLLDQSGELCLALADTVPGFPEDGLRFEVVRRAIRPPHAVVRQTIVILDCCYGGRALDGEMGPSADLGARTVIDGVCVLTAAAATRRSLCPPGEEFSAFTGELIRLLREGVPGGGPDLDMDTVHGVLARTLREKGRPEPQQGARNAGGRIVLARNRAHAPARRRVVIDTRVAPPRSLVGREADLERLTSPPQGRAGSVVWVLHGMGGAGKTALARAAAARIADDFPDGRLELDLYGFSPGEKPRPPEEVLTDLLHRVGFRPAEVPVTLAGQAEAWRGWLSGRRVLLLLDNALDEEQVRPLLPGAGAAGLTLVTSRDRLDGLETPHRLPVGALSEDDAVAMLCGLGGRGGGDGKLAEIAAVCGRWPLALNAVGTLLRDLSPADLLAAMGDLRRPLELVPEGERSVRTAFDLSYRALDVELRTVLHACAWHPGLDYDRDSVAAMLDRPKALTPVHLAALVRRNMLLAVDGRYRLHDVFRHVARETAEREAPGGAVTARRRLQEHLLERLNAALAWLQGVEPAHEPEADMGLFPDPLSARDWLTAASPELEAAALAWDEPHPSGPDAELGAALARRTARWFRLDNRTEQALRLSEALERRASREEDFILMADAHCDLAAVFELRGDYEEAEEHYRRARHVYRENGDQRGVAVAHGGIATAKRLRRDHTRVQSRYEAALATFTGLRDRRGCASVLSGLGHVAVGRGEAAEARERYESALELCERIGDRLGAAEALSGLGRAAVLRDALQEAAALFRDAADRYDAIGVTDAAAYCREQLKRLGHPS
nr:hypothetical protein GCM10010200_030240 [Actinomadura rugatobispora]